MSTGVFRNARQAIRAYFLESTAEQIDPTRIAWENNRFDPPDPNPTSSTYSPYWIRESCQVVSERLAGFDLRELIGRTVFDVMWPINKRTEKAEDLCQLIADSFEARSSITNNSTVVGIDRIVRETPFKWDDAWWMTSIGIYWRTYSVATLPENKI